ncbi:hypothetical protein JZ751_017545 [Albula glossodonta]|uniref:Plexin cytoplasmic RasGAP domain-containing protein n=1 Tax=Albula glossodonta TaxID=121402 RepID=A0A8T2PKT7_9TELE|nr:hypothetical protein JZ751_017545 [Albula glossodonta]
MGSARGHSGGAGSLLPPHHSCPRSSVRLENMEWGRDGWYYADIRQTISASDQEMNSALAELSRNYSGELNYLVALHELYKYINKYYDQIITALEEDTTAQKMQLGYRLQQIAAAVENKVTDL